MKYKKNQKNHVKVEETAEQPNAFCMNPSSVEQKSMLNY
jgi:hypothetical protein